MTRRVVLTILSVLLLAVLPASAELFRVTEEAEEGTPLPIVTATPRPTATPTPIPTPTPTPTAEPTEVPTPTPKPTPTAAPTARVQVRTEDGSFPELNEEGFLDDGEFIYKDVDNGIWRYCSSTLKVEVTRLQTRAPKMCWYEAEIFTTENEAFHMLPFNDNKPMKVSTYPYKVARKNKTVFAVTTDYGHSRLYGHSKYPGIIIRNGVIYSEKTRPAHSNKFPNLDILAMYPDGNMEVYLSDEHTAQEYLDMGVESTLAFGPIMVKDGEMTEDALNKYGKAKNPRVAIGMVEKGHYWIIFVEGRSMVSNGITVPTLTKMMHEKGVDIAFNLDGGGTACLVFMGNQITRIGDSRASQKSARSTADLVSIGTSLQVPYNGD